MFLKRRQEWKIRPESKTDKIFFLWGEGGGRFPILFLRTFEVYEKRNFIKIFCVKFFLRGRTQAYWPIVLYLLFKFIGSCLKVQPPYRGPRSRSASLLLFVSNPSWQSPRSASLPVPTPGIRIECVPMFSFLHRTSCIKESLLSSSCATCTTDWYDRLGA